MTKITVDKALIEQAVEAHAWALDHLPNGAAQTKVRASLASLRTALAKPVVETDDPLHCDLCGDATDDPWHFSTLQDRHKHACDQCWESKKALRAALAPVAVEPVSSRHPVVVHWRNDGIEACAGIADAYGSVGAARDMRAMITPPPAEVPLLTTDEYTTLAHRIASKYAHRSDPQHIAYTFLPHTLEQFARAIEQAVRQNAGLK